MQTRTVGTMCTKSATKMKIHTVSNKNSACTLHDHRPSKLDTVKAVTQDEQKEKKKTE